MNITIRNCKNIDSGTVSIQPGKLNIKYAINGTVNLQLHKLSIV